jgi:hypothetical protein
VTVNRQIIHHKRQMILKNVVFCFLFQVILLLLILYEQIYYFGCKFFIYEFMNLQLCARLICGTILHLCIVDDQYKAIDLMRYSLNHPYNFYNPYLAFFIPFLSFVSTAGVELVCVAVIITSFTPLGIVYNFIALQVISQFDEFVYFSIRNESLKKLFYETVVEKVLVVKHTTSKRCKDEELSTVNDEFGKKRPLKVTFKSRTFANKLLYILYKLLRIYFVSFVVYF